MCSCFVKKLLNKFTEAIKGLALLIGSRLYCNLKTSRRLFQNNRVIVSWVLQTNHYVLSHTMCSPTGQKMIKKKIWPGNGLGLGLGLTF